MLQIRVFEYSNNYEKKYEEFLNSCPNSMIYHSIKYRNFLSDFLPSSVEPNYILAFKDNSLEGVLPTFLMDGPKGKVINSLPFFGSNGGILLRDNNCKDTAQSLLQAFNELCKKKKITFATLIDTPFINNALFYKSNWGFQFTDQRIGQITSLPSGNDLPEIEEKLFSIFHQKTRNMVRKGLKSGLKFSNTFSNEALEALYNLHQTNLLKIGGIPKPKSFFSSIVKNFQYNKDYHIYTAKNTSNEIVCAMMLLYFKDTIEYFVPAISEKWRNKQPLSALIFLAMKKSIIEKNIKKWNWGGTWLEQDGVYRFKSRWGSKDYIYNYYTSINENFSDLKIKNNINLVKEYPWFYLFPFKQNKNK